MDRKIITFTWFLFILVACNSSQSPTAPFPSQIPSRTETPVFRTMTPTKMIVSNPTKSFVLTSEASILRDMGFLSGIPCTAPCFLGITPGETSFDSVLDILEIYLDKPVCFSKQEDVIACSKPGEFGSILHIGSSPSTGVVDGISYTPYTSYPIYLRDIIAHYGNPDQIYVEVLPNEAPVSMVILFFDAIQTRIELKEIAGMSYDISENSEIDFFIFYDEREYLEDRTLLAQDSWKGYGIYP